MTILYTNRLYALAADLVVAVHVAYVGFVVVGQLLVLVGILCRWNWIRNPWFRGLHLAAILIVVAEAWLGVTCPLTTWEQSLRRMAGTGSYEGSFIGRILHDLLFFDLPLWVFTAIYTLFGLLVAGTWLIAPPRRRGVSVSTRHPEPADERGLS